MYYADDTLIVVTDARSATDISHQAEHVSEQCGLKLNRDKCCYIAMNGGTLIKFKDGTRLKRVPEATYLGHQLAQTVNIRHEINYKMKQTLIAWYKLELLLKAVGCSTRLKLEVYDAIMQNKLWYGLEKIHLATVVQKTSRCFST